MSLGANMTARALRLHRLLLVMVLAALGTAAGNTIAVAAGASSVDAGSIQCLCCKERKGGYPPAHCTFLCDKEGGFDMIYFEPGSSSLTPVAKKILRKQAICLKLNETGATLYASADPYETPSQKSAGLLSKHRAAATKKFLVSLDIRASAIRLVALGRRGQGAALRTPDDRRLYRYVRTEPRTSSR